MLSADRSQKGLPLFHLYGDPPDDQAFDFVHVETAASRAVRFGWNIGAHRHRNLFQIILIERGAGEVMHDDTTTALTVPAAILVAPNVVHAFRFVPELTDGWVVSFTEDAAQPFGERYPFALAQLKRLSNHPVIALQHEDPGTKRLLMLCDDLLREQLSVRAGYQHAMRGLLALIAIELIRLAAVEPQRDAIAHARKSATVGALERLLEEHAYRERHVAFYADKLAMTPDRLNDHIKRATGVTAGRLIRQRVLTEAKRRLAFTNEPIQRIAFSLAFSDLSHFIRFFRQSTGKTPQAFRQEK